MIEKEIAALEKESNQDENIFKAKYVEKCMEINEMKS
jgi:hypothetical protein